MDSKEYVVGELLAYLGLYLDPAEAVVATLGGNGLEARIWKEKGVDPANAWLIERSATRVRRLVRGFPGFNILQGNLDRFPEVFRSSLGDKPGLDLFHWDLCGTVEPAIDEICGVFPLLARGRRPILGLTVADQRMNRQTKSFDFSQDICRSFYGAWWNELAASLVGICREESRYRAFDIEKAVLREAGTLMYLALAMATVRQGENGFTVEDGLFPLRDFLKLVGRKADVVEFEALFSAIYFNLTPIHLERYSYGSHLSGFRMRTYFMGLQAFSYGLPFRRLVESLVGLVVHAPSHVVDGESRTKIWPQRMLVVSTQTGMDSEEHTGASTSAGGNQKVMSEKTIEQIRESFAPVLALPLPKIREDFETLCRLAELGLEAKGKISAASDLLTMAQRALDGTPTSVGYETETPGATDQSADQSAENGSSASEKPRLKPSALKRLEDLKLKDEIRLELLEAKLEGDAAYAKKRKEVVKQLGLRGKTGHKIGSIEAWGSGKYRPAFAARVLTRKLRTIERLAELLKESPIIIMREALAAGFKN